jgi:hypothetical protein
MKVVYGNKETEQFLKEEGIEFKVEKNGKITIAEPIDDAELFGLGVAHGKALRDKPEEFLLGKPYIEMFKAAMSAYQSESGILVDSISFKDGEKGSVVIVAPTNIVCLFNIFKKYGEAVASYKATAEQGSPASSC